MVPVCPVLETWALGTRKLRGPHSLRGGEPGRSHSGRWVSPLLPDASSCARSALGGCCYSNRGSPQEVHPFAAMHCGWLVYTQDSQYAGSGPSSSRCRRRGLTNSCAIFTGSSLTAVRAAFPLLCSLIIPAPSWFSQNFLGRILVDLKWNREEMQNSFSGQLCTSQVREKRTHTLVSFPRALKWMAFLISKMTMAY